MNSNYKKGRRELKKRRYKYLAGVLLCLAAINIQVPDTVLAGTWQQEENNWWYQEEDGIWPAWQWKEIDNKWYYFDENGYCVTGWRKIDDNWYDFDKNGVLQTGRWIDEYYVGTDGRMLMDTWVGRYWVDSEGKKDTSIKKEKDLPLESLTLNKESITLLRGETANLLTQWQPQDTTRWKYMQWTSSDPSVAEVSRGKITAVGEGTAIITVSMGTKEATCTVTVTDSAVCKTALKLLDAQYIWGGNDLNADNFARYGQEVSREELQPGDAICTCYNGERYQHILLYIGNDMVVASECGGPTVCSLGLSCDQHVKGTKCNCRTWKRPLNENDLVNAKFVRMDRYKT